MLTQLTNNKKVQRKELLAKRRALTLIQKNEYSAVIIEEFKLPFGKHKGKTLLEIKAEAPDYIDWMKTQSMRAPIPALLKILEETG